MKVAKAAKVTPTCGLDTISDNVDQATALKGVEKGLEIVDKAEARRKARERFKASYESVVPTREIRPTGDGPSISLRGIVTRHKNVQVCGRSGQQIPMIEVDLLATHASTNGALDALVSDVIHGLAYALPTKKPSNDLDDTASVTEAEAPGGKRKAYERAPRTLAFGAEYHKTIDCNFVRRLRVISTGRDGKPKEGLDSIAPGMLVEVGGVVANDTPTGVWIDGRSLTPLLDSVHPSCAVGMIVDQMTKPDVLKASAIKLSQVVSGFHGLDFASPAQEEQASIFREAWVALKTEFVEKCEERARTIHTELGPNGVDPSNTMLHHSRRIAALSPKDLAYGKPLFTTPMSPTQEYPEFYAPVVLLGSSPKEPEHRWLKALHSDDPSDAANVPETFAAPEVVHASVEGMLYKVYLRMTFVGSAKKFVEQLDRGENAIVHSHAASVGLKLPVRNVAQSTGIVVAAKSTFFALDLFKFGVWAAVVGIVPREPTQDNVFCNFPSTFALDLPSSLKKIAVRVGEDWVVEHLAGGASAYIYEKDPGQEMLRDKENKSDLASDVLLSTNGYQEITGSSFRFNSARMPPDKTEKNYFVWWDKAPACLADDESILGDTKRGEAAVEAARACALSANEDMLTFLLTFCAVYVVAV